MLEYLSHYGSEGEALRVTETRKAFSGYLKGIVWVTSPAVWLCCFLFKEQSLFLHVFEYLTPKPKKKIMTKYNYYLKPLSFDVGCSAANDKLENMWRCFRNIKWKTCCKTIHRV